MTHRPGESIRATAIRYGIRRSTIAADYQSGRLPGVIRGKRTILVNPQRAAELYGVPDGAQA